MSYNIKSPNIWFFETVEERNNLDIPRLKMCPGQLVPDGGGNFIPCNTSLNTQGPVAPRTDNPIGTIFASKDVTITKTVKGSEHYSISKMITIERGVSKDISDAYNAYQASVGGATLEDEAEVTSPTSKIAKLIDKYPVPTVDADGFYIDPEVWKTLLINVANGYNTMLVGESGTGKTEMTQILAKVLGKDIAIVDMAAKQDPIASLIGVHRFDGKSVFDRAEFTYLLEKPGIVVLDELPRAPANTNNILFPILDSRKELRMDIASSELRSITVNKDCRFIATANEGYRYTGNNVLDQALKERFNILHINFMPEANEIELLRKRTTVGLREATVVVKAATQIRNLVNNDELNQGVSIRHTLYAADLVACGFTLLQGMEKAFLPMYNIKEEKQKVMDILSSR